MGEFPAYSPPKRQKPIYSLSWNSAQRSGDDSDFEVVSMDTPRPSGYGSRSFESSRYNSDSSDDETPVQPSDRNFTKAALPDVVESTGLTPKAMKRFNSSDSESDDSEGTNIPGLVSGAKSSKRPRMKIGLPTPVAKIRKTELQKSSNISDNSGSESDTPLASFKKKSKIDVAESAVVQRHSQVKDVCSPVKKRPMEGKKSKTGLGHETDGRRDTKSSSAGRLPEFHGIGMLDADSEVSVRKKEPVRQFDDVVYGADILAELFASDDSSDESSEESSGGDINLGTVTKKENKLKDIQSAIDDMLSLNKGMELKSSKSNSKTEGGSTETESSDTDTESDEETSDEQDNEAVEEEISDNKEHDGNEAETSKVESESESENDTSDDDDDDDVDTESNGSKELTSKLKKVVGKANTSATGKKDYNSDSSDNDKLQPTKSQVLSDAFKCSSTKKGLLSNVSIIDEFSSGFVETAGGGLKEKNNDNVHSDSEEDLLDMVSSGKMKKIKEFERKAGAEIPIKESKIVKQKTNEKKSTCIETGEEGNKKSKRDRSDTTDTKTQRKDQLETKSVNQLKKSEGKPKTKQQKHAADNERRVQSLRQKEQEIKGQKAAIKSALASVVSTQIF